MEMSLKRKIVIKIKACISKVVLFFLYRGFKAGYKFDERIRKEIDGWQDGFTAVIETGVKNLKLCIRKKMENYKSLKIRIRQI